MLEGGFEWRHDFTTQEVMQETENDLSFQKHKKISTPTAKCSGGFFEGFTELSLTEFPPFRRISTLLMQTSAQNTKLALNSQRGLKAVLVFDIQIHRGSHLLQEMLSFASAAESHSRGRRFQALLKHVHLE